MQRIETANQLSGRATGALFCAGFGALWLGLSFYAMGWLSVTTVAAILVGLAALVAAALQLMSEAKRWPQVPDDPAVGRAFAWINAAEWIAVGVTAFALAKLHLDAYVMCAITAIVGLHMFPLGRLFKYPAHYRAGAIMVLWAVASAVLVPLEHLQGVSALGTGILLWSAAAVNLAIAFRDARRSAAVASMA